MPSSSAGAAFWRLCQAMQVCIDMQVQGKSRAMHEGNALKAALHILLLDVFRSKKLSMPSCCSTSNAACSNSSAWRISKETAQKQASASKFCLHVCTSG
eukprot:1157699-Pelagomonas_calceolata.AAC.2